MPLAAQFGFDVEGVGAVEVDVVVLRGRQVRGGLVCDWGVPIGTQGIEGVAEIRRRSEDGGVGDQGQAEGLVHLVVEVAAADVAWWAKNRSRRSACRLSPLFSCRRTRLRSSSLAT